MSLNLSQVILDRLDRTVASYKQRKSCRGETIVDVNVVETTKKVVYMCAPMNENE